MKIVDAHIEVATIFKALSEPTRLALVHCLADSPHVVNELVEHLGYAQSTISSHLAVLKRAGLVAAQAEGRTIRYSLANPAVEALLRQAEETLALAHSTPHTVPIPAKGNIA